jgi:hypothetical protein
MLMLVGRSMYITVCSWAMSYVNASLYVYYSVACMIIVLCYYVSRYDGISDVGLVVLRNSTPGQLNVGILLMQCEFVGREYNVVLVWCSVRSLL